MQRRIKDGLIILISTADSVRLFGDKLNLSRIVAVPQTHFCPRLIRKLLGKLDDSMPSVNNTTGREVALESLQFGKYFPRTLQLFWEADMAQGLVWVYKLDVTDVYHRGTITPSQVGAFSYVVPLVPGEEGCTICTNLVLPMGWADSPKFFYTFSDVAKADNTRKIATRHLVIKYVVSNLMRK